MSPSKMGRRKFSEWLPQFVSNPNWRQAWFVSGFFSLAWIGLASLIPDHYFKPVAVIVVLIQSLILYIIRGGKYVVDRELEIPDGVVVTPPTIPTGKLPSGVPPA
jgi:hypothetical protein